jgi:hypothetical protein
MKQEVILFVHIPKTAGTTVQLFFEQQFAPQEMFSLNSQGRDPFQEFSAQPDSVKQRVRVVKGHMRFGLHELIDRPCAYVTLLRHPIDRIVSLYHYALEQPKMHLHDQAHRMSLEEFVLARVDEEVDNCHVRVLSGHLYAPYGSLTDADLQLAKANLQKHFAVVGIQDNVSGFLAAMAKRFGLRNLRIPPQNVTKKRPKWTTIPDAARRTIENCNKLDLELYDFAVKNVAVTDAPPALSRWRHSIEVMVSWAPAVLAQIRNSIMSASKRV